MSLKAKYKGALVFKSAMMIFFPDLIIWQTKNAESFLKEDSDIINSIASFIQEHQTDGIGLPSKKIRETLTQKVAQMRKKYRKPHKIMRKYLLLNHYMF